MSDIVERLREWANRAAQGWDDGPIIGSAELRDAADEIERLRAEAAQGVREARHAARRISDANRRTERAEARLDRLLADIAARRDEAALGKAYAYELDRDVRATDWCRRLLAAIADSVAEYGGDEFLLIAEKVRAEMEKKR